MTFVAFILYVAFVVAFLMAAGLSSDLQSERENHKETRRQRDQWKTRAEAAEHALCERYPPAICP